MVISRVTPFRALITLLITYLLSPLPLQVGVARSQGRLFLCWSHSLLLSRLLTVPAIDKEPNMGLRVLGFWVRESLTCREAKVFEARTQDAYLLSDLQSTHVTSAPQILTHESRYANQTENVKDGHVNYLQGSSAQTHRQRHVGEQAFRRVVQARNPKPSSPNPYVPTRKHQTQTR